MFEKRLWKSDILSKDAGQSGALGWKWFNIWLYLNEYDYKKKIAFLHLL